MMIVISRATNAEEKWMKSLEILKFCTIPLYSLSKKNQSAIYRMIFRNTRVGTFSFHKEKEREEKEGKGRGNSVRTNDRSRHDRELGGG